MGRSLRSAPPPRRWAVLAAAGLVGVAGWLPATTAGAAEAAGDGRGRPQEVSIADPDATAETRSLFAYLLDQQGEGILFGHQQTTEFGVTFDEATETDGVRSDVLAGVGDHPAVFGWDVGHDGYGSSPGDPTPEENFAATVRLIEAADRIGGIHTLSAHMDNFVTGGDFYDTDGNVVERILPGGDHNDEFRAYLDRVARLAHAVDDEDGDPIPMVFRPFHENSGSWFWWGAAHASSSQYVELFRYTVEYLRDVKDVHNFLYSYSPGGSYGGSDEVYMRTYPGDAYVDVLGYDNYDGSGASRQWLDGLVADLGMVARIAEERGKVSAFTEFGISGALKPNGGNGNPNWYTDVLAAIAADPLASRSAYMLTWVNFGTEQFFLPYPATATEPEHELLPDFRAFHQDPATIFSSELDLRDVYDRRVRAREHEPFAHIVSPTDRQRITTPTTTVRVRISDARPLEVYYTVGDDPTRHPLRLDRRSGYHTGEWRIGEENLTNVATSLRVHATLPGNRSLEVTNRILLGEKPPLAPGVVDDFEGHVDDTALRADYSTYGANTISLSQDPKGSGEQALRFDYDFARQTYTGVGKKIDGDWSGYDGLSLWLKPDGSGHRLVLQLVAGGVAYEAYPSMTGTEAQRLTIPFADFRPAPWDTANADRRITPEDLADLSQFNIFINQADGAATTAGTFHLDDLRAG
ncbi:glycosyl hydrolase [Allostreptomyces psammosilenae]|uniref:Mannan endo-1,4-beta-mannosidase n=1 Tax=Allostreptomyces psammosilenae TaxID=1892865 RepID=A0A853A1I2_9ACTN|nr:glycosyl hydrolase [Allostreptomyces psammosilenae]NYI07310.1 mannan endo-1,4-beta-mannosidase [Allostreptomyces psammosilenae]